MNAKTTADRKPTQAQVKEVLKEESFPSVPLDAPTTRKPPKSPFGWTKTKENK